MFQDTNFVDKNLHCVLRSAAKYVQDIDCTNNLVSIMGRHIVTESQEN
jgi:hypothetical protein